MTSPAPNDPHRKTKTEPGSKARFDHWGGVAAASLTAIVVAVIGLFGATRAGVVYIGVGNQPTIIVTATTTTTLQAPSGQGGSAPSPSASGRTGSVSLSVGYCADLDSDALNWSVTSSCINSENDISFWNAAHGMQLANADASETTTGSGTTLADCESATAYANDIDMSAVAKGQSFCVRTSDGNTALITFSAIPNSAQVPKTSTVTFSVTRWDTQ